jgi:branched-chain amino acid transport system substrate-binding protein
MKLAVWLLTFVSVVALAFTPAASAQTTLRVGAVLSQSGPAATEGRAQGQALRALTAQLQSQGGIFGLPVEIQIVDDGSNPRDTVAQLQRLIAAGEVSALICCTTEAEVKAAAPVVEAAGVPTLALSALPDSAGEGSPHWLFSVRASEQDVLRAIVLHVAAQGGKTVALMTLNNNYGDAASADLHSLLVPGGLRLVAEKRYAPNVRVLTPEALWVATRQPDAVIVWGLVKDTEVAVSALRQRGYEGPVYINPQLLSAQVGSVLDGTLTVGGSSPSALLSRYRALMAPYYLFGFPPPAGAYAFDALWLLRGALKQTLGYGIDLSKAATMRQVLRDSLVGMGPVTGVTAVFDYTEANHTGVEPKSLAIVKVGK